MLVRLRSVQERTACTMDAGHDNKLHLLRFTEMKYYKSLYLM